MAKVHQNYDYTYKYLSSSKNPSWSLDKLIPLRSCLIRNNDGKVFFGDLIMTQPKRLTTLGVTRKNLETGEIYQFEHYTDDFKASWNRQSKAVKKFCDYYEPLYRKKEVSVRHLVIVIILVVVFLIGMKLLIV